MTLSSIPIADGDAWRTRMDFPQLPHVTPGDSQGAKRKNGVQKSGTSGTSGTHKKNGT